MRDKKWNTAQGTHRPRVIRNGSLPESVLPSLLGNGTWHIGYLATDSPRQGEPRVLASGLELL